MGLGSLSNRNRKPDPGGSGIEEAGGRPRGGKQAG